MAKTIKGMAIAYGKVNYIVRYTADGDKEIDENTGAEFFEDGANAVPQMKTRTFECIFSLFLPKNQRL